MLFDDIFSSKSLTYQILSGIVRALAARYGYPIPGRTFESALKKGRRIFTVAPWRRPLQKELQAFSQASKSLKTKEKYRRLIFFVT